MKDEDKIFQLIETYLKGDLKGKELAAFEKEVKENVDLQKKVKMHKMANELVIENRLREVRNILHEQHNQEGKNIRKYLSVAITGIVLIASFVLIITNIKTDKKARSEKTESKSEKPLPSDKNIEQKNSAIENTKIPIIQNNTITKQEETKSERDKNYINGYNPIEKDSIIPSTSEQVPLKKDSVINTTPLAKNEEKKQENPMLHDDPCQRVNITADLSVNAACAGEENGAILISNIKGGYNPYKLSVFDKKHEVFNSNLKLPAGSYQVEITDNKGCLKTMKEITVPQKICEKDYSFNPFMGESWNIPSYTQEGMLIIYNDQGNIQFEKEIPGGAEEQWSGQSRNGEVKTGYYIFVIRYKDGSQVKGSVTIVR